MGKNNKNRTNHSLQNIKKNHKRSSRITFILLFILLGSVLLYKVFAADPQTQIKTVQGVSAPKGHPPNIASNLLSGAASSIPGLCSGIFCYYYVGASTSTSNTGASVLLSQPSPTLAPSTIDTHTLAEMAVETSDYQQIVEFGWTVDRNINGDSKPHLFVYRQVNGAGTCYNGCGFVATNSLTAGSLIPPSTKNPHPPATYKIHHSNNQWQFFYNGTMIGYYPDSLWNNNFTKAGLVQVFGEVVGENPGPPKSQMGNGILGSQPNSAQISAFAVLGSSTNSTLSPPFIYGDPRSYNYGAATSTSFRFGGPGGY